MVWMRSDVDISTPLDQGFRQSKAWFWPWAVAGVFAVAALALTEAPAWAFALALVAWCVVGALWFRSDVVFVPRHLAEQAPAALAKAVDEPESAPSTVAGVALVNAEPAWRRWISGWYWETDAQGHLQALQPAGEKTDGLTVQWDLLSEYVGKKPAFLSIWPNQGSNGVPENDLGRLAYCLTHHTGWDAALDLPWPASLSGLTPEGEEAGDSWRCALLGEPRWAAQGHFQGFRGVMRWLAPEPLAAPVSLSAAVARPVADAVVSQAEAEAAAQSAHMREAEQEVLRYALSHDLRAPLRVVEGFTRIVKEDYGKSLDKLGNDHLERVLTAAARMNGMIDAILAQAELAAEPLQRVAINLSAMAREIGAEQAALMQSQGKAPAQLVVDDGLHVDADPLLVRRVLENLISNALKYSGKVETPRVEVGVMPATNPAVFFVRDNGAGFDMQHADKLFGMFQRLHSAKDFPGTGVGLAGVHNIVRRHGGRIWAEAKPGQGACFYFTLMDAVEAQQRAGRL